MTILYPFIQILLEWTFNKSLPTSVSLWDQYKYIAFNIFSCRILIISYKMFIITGISNEKTNILIIYGKLCRNVTLFYRQKSTSLYQVQEKLKACRSSKLNFSSSYFYADDSHVEIIWLHAVVFFEHDILHFWDNVHSQQQERNSDFDSTVADETTILHTNNCPIQTLKNYQKYTSIAYINCQSILSTFDKLAVMLKSYEFDIISLSET